MNNEESSFLRKCIEIYSPSGEEQKYAEFISDFLKNHGFKVTFDAVGNLYAEKGEGKPVLLLVSHLDTIPGEIQVCEKDCKIFGRGAIDCKSSLAAMVYSISKYTMEKDSPGKIIFVGIVREEDSLEGIEEFLKSNVNADYAIFGEPTQINQICIGYKGRICVGFRVLTQTGHIASSWQYISAIDVSLEIWNIVKSLCWHFTDALCQNEEKAKYYNKIIPNLTVITGGELTNCIPSECVIQIDIRFPPNVNPEQLLTEIRKNVLQFKGMYEKNSNKKITIQENISSYIEGYEVDANNVLIGALRWAIFNVTKEKAKLIKKTGTTFVNHIGNRLQIPSITYGPGDSKLEHTENEFIEIDEFSKAIEIYSKFIPKFFELCKKKSPKNDSD